MNEVTIGSRVVEKIEALGKVLTGEVVYIHPLKRFYVAKFTMESGKEIREAFISV